MQKSKNAFTMIELIFVIVILGILAAVIFPRLSATRADAKAATKAHTIMTAATEIASYAISIGQTDSDLSKMSNSISFLVLSSEAVLENNKAIISAGSISDCVTIEMSIGVADDTLIITFGDANNDSACSSLQSLINQDEFPIKLRGFSVVY